MSALINIDASAVFKSLNNGGLIITSLGYLYNNREIVKKFTERILQQILCGKFNR
jgi:hypothetical protein